ncbi:hypothetical protein HOR18_gp050 [Staphylococcus phage vB_SscM-1]|uniref:Uncharacterized protein n=2 Tax=Sciuriunavirus SscM1 TaxID=2734053 RepID=A0A1X9I9J9_9CAUD|nr:hypothetical protein HOR18_gp050 [Staphylococcus phage vB_SscM-1]ANT44713.1 hypothetical protein vB_SscM-1_050 [Staphylococcus phage vB_SscM-1]ANT44915.1 hypothetical protein vB_SscM-2_048 [Staphylococcus phage vB_SscM-2]
MEKYVEFKEIGLDMEIEIYDVSNNKVDTGIVTSIYDEESYVITIYSPEKGTFEVYPEDRDYNIKILNRDSKSAETAIVQEYASDLMKEFRKHNYLMKSSVNHYKTERDALSKSLRAMNSLSSIQRNYYKKLIDIEKELEYYGRSVPDFYPEPKQLGDLIIVDVDEFNRLRLENKELTEKFKKLDDANGEEDKQCNCKQCKCTIRD